MIDSLLDGGNFTGKETHLYFRGAECVGRVGTKITADHDVGILVDRELGSSDPRAARLVCACPSTRSKEPATKSELPATARPPTNG